MAPERAKSWTAVVMGGLIRVQELNGARADGWRAKQGGLADGSERGGAADGGLGAVGGRRGLDALRTLKQRYAERNATGKRCIK